MNFNFIKTKIDDLLIIENKKYGDSRGYFSETYNKKEFEKANLYYNFVQDNQSYSTKGVLRGLHFQKKHPQAKLVRVIEGSVFDVAVDIRKDSDTYGDWVGVVLTENNNRQFLIPKGFAHGFLVLSDHALFCYKCDDFYHPEDEGGIIWNDKDLAIDWPLICEPILSEKDKHNQNFSELVI